MASKYATVVDGVVTNVSLWDGVSDWQPEVGTLVSVPDGQPVGPEWTYVDGVFVAPPVPERTLEDQQVARAAAYQFESDPLFFRWQRGEGAEQEWLDAVEAIRQRYPYPTAP